MGAYGSAHFWARQLQSLGHAVVLLPPHQVRPYVTRNKTDRADAKGILEAYRNSDLRPVPVKTVPQQVLGSIHRFRAGTVYDRHSHDPEKRAALEAWDRRLDAMVSGKSAKGRVFELSASRQQASRR
jgi:transposase